MSIEIIVLRFAYCKAKTPLSVVPFSIILVGEILIIFYKTVLKCSPAVAGTDFFIPIPAGIYTGKNLKVVLTKSDDSTETMSTNQDAEINIFAGTMYGFNFKKDGAFVLGPSEKKVSTPADVL